jgi:hypothetical protein
MAIVYPLANGNWSTVANWYSGGVAYGQLPLATDDVYADGKTVTIDQDITVNLLTTLQRSGGTIGGGFNCNTARTINSTTITGQFNCLNLTCTGITQNVISTNIYGITNAQTTGTILITGTSGTVNITVTNIYYSNYINGHAVVNGTGNTLNIIGNLSGGASNGVLNTTGTLNITGNIQSSGNTLYGVNQNGAGGVTNIIGNLIGGINNNGYCVYNTIGTVNILSNQTMTGTGGIGVYSNAGTTNFGTALNPITITGAPSSAASGLYACYHAGNGNVNLYGNIVQQNYSFSTTLGLFRKYSTSGTMTINGNITGGTVANTIGLNIENIATVIVNGNVTGGSNATNTPAIYMTQAATITINGTATSNSYPAIWSTVTGAKFNLLGDVVNTASVVAYYGSINVKISPSNAQQFTYVDANNNNRVIATSNITAGAPIPANVRLGVVYGSLSQYTGTLAMASPADVRNGVATDNTVGTADLTAEDIFNEIGSSSNTIAVRLRNVSTVQTTGDQLASYQV